MRITKPQMERRQDTVEVSAEVDGFRLWYRVPGSYAVSQTADSFLAAALLPAMARGEPLEIDASLLVCPRFLTHVGTLQEIYYCWNPALHKIPISTETAPGAPVNAGVLSFFSGGVDSTYTLLTRAAEITHTVFIHGFDSYVDPDICRVAIERNTAFVRSMGKSLIPVETNYRSFGYGHNLSMFLTHGSTLASVALLLGFPRVFIPSTNAYDDLFPWGSHPLTDPLWSSDSVTIVHDGAGTRRIDKVRTIAGQEAALANLTVCARNMNSNCGRCDKCLYTMIALQLLQVQGPFPPLPPLRVIRKMPIGSFARSFVAENIALARQSGDGVLQKALSASLHHHERQQLLKLADRVLLGGLLKRAYRRTWKSRCGAPRIQPVPD